MGLMAETGIIQTVALCEIETFSRIEGLRFFTTTRVVGCVSLLEVTQQEPYIIALGVEIHDNKLHNLEVKNVVASKIDNTIVTISSLEEKLSCEFSRRMLRVPC